MRSTQANTLLRVQSTEVGKFERSSRRWSCGLMVSGVLGVFCGVTGLLINLFFVIGIAENKGLMGLLAIWLLVAAFPMLWLTSHCLDKVDVIGKARRLEYCRQNRLEQENKAAAN